jgi:tRNA 5-methylaminomethyl-2-thiouridine biosynthesis bifunctional protein
VARIRQTGDHWQLFNENGECLQASKLVVAAGHQSASVLPATGELRLKPIRGQISCLPEDAFNLPRTVICGTKYLNPAMGGEAVTGATFDLRDNNPEETPQSHQDNLDELLQLLPSVHKNDQVAPEHLAGRVAFRCTTHDYQPVAGPMQDSSGRPAAENLFMFTGLGSKGLAWAPLLAEYLADCLTDQPRTLPGPLAKRVATGRLYRA